MKFTLILATLSFALVANAEGRRANVRQDVQRARIHEGVQSGELNRAEAARLRSGQRHVRRVERRAEADGQVSAEEQARLEQAQDVQSRRIERQKHDAQTQQKAE